MSEVSILLVSYSSQYDSAKQQCCLSQTFTWPKKLQRAEVAGYVVDWEIGV